MNQAANARVNGASSLQQAEIESSFFPLAPEGGRCARRAVLPPIGEFISVN
jgi:hypothetical protein